MHEDSALAGWGTRVLWSCVVSSRLLVLLVLLVQTRAEVIITLANLAHNKLNKLAKGKLEMAGDGAFSGYMLEYNTIQHAWLRESKD